jgi:2-C-methyl-D-erythritol 4-phosphate cytidylyltransferase
VSVGVLVPAAGRGERLGPGRPKALRELAGRPLLLHAVRGLRAAASVGPVVVAAPPDDLDEVRALLAELGTVVVAGGQERSDSVACALRALPVDVDLVLVHDAARCLTPPAVVERVVTALRLGAPAVVPVLPVADTVKEVDDAGRVVRTVPRARLRSVQTPQGFARDVLERAHAAGRQATDDAALVEALGVPVSTVAGSEQAFKVTRPVDLFLAEALLSAGLTVGPAEREVQPGG